MKDDLMEFLIGFFIPVALVILAAMLVQILGIV